MMNIRIVRMLVPQHFVPVQMCVRLRASPSEVMLVPMMLVVAMAMRMN